jgi:signal transduction histidine kinase
VNVEVDDNARRLTTDRTYISRVLGNLVSNAIPAMPSGGKLSIQARRNAQNTVITVEDTGVSISAEYNSKIFQPLFTTKSKGQGLGLAVVKRLTEAINGTITFTSEEGRGTKFTIQVPSLNRNNKTDDK